MVSPALTPLGTQIQTAKVVFERSLHDADLGSDDDVEQLMRHVRFFTGFVPYALLDAPTCTVTASRPAARTARSR